MGNLPGSPAAPANAHPVQTARAAAARSRPASYRRNSCLAPAPGSQNRRHPDGQENALDLAWMVYQAPVTRPVWLSVLMGSRAACFSGWDTAATTLPLNQASRQGTPWTALYGPKGRRLPTGTNHPVLLRGWHGLNLDGRRGEHFWHYACRTRALARRKTSWNIFTPLPAPGR